MLSFCMVGFFFPRWLKHCFAYQLISVYHLFGGFFSHSSCLNFIHLQRLILCLICVVRHKTTEILNILKGLSDCSLEEGQDDTSLVSC